jgi:RNA polymerase sigma-70 factor (sigma-E family)
MPGDQDFEVAFDHLFARAYRHARRLVGDPTLAEDLAAEALARTYRHWRRVSAYDHLDAWVLRVVTNLAIDAQASRGARAVDATPPSPEDGVVLRLALAQALRALPARQRDAVVLRYLVDMTEADVAATLGIAPGTVKSHLHRAIERLRRALGSDLDIRFEEA